MRVTRKLVPVAAAALLAGGVTSQAEAKRGPGSGKVRACMEAKGLTKADRGTPEFRAALGACFKEAGLTKPGKGKRGDGAARRGARA